MTSSLTRTGLTADRTENWNEASQRAQPIVAPDGVRIPAQMSSAIKGAQNSQRVSARRIFNVRPESMWESALPSPYSALAWADMPNDVRAPIVARGKQAAWEAMTSQERAAVTHPSLVSVPGGWGGYAHWCAFTPYPKADSVFENPCLVASSDLKTWVVPDGIQNPIVPPPTPVGYNSDTCLYWDESNRRMVLIYRTRNDTAGTNTIYVMTASEPRRWSSPVAIWTGLIASAQDMASPSIWFNAGTKRWVIVGHNVDGGATWPFWRITSANLISGWDINPVAMSMPHPVAGRRWWHSHFIQLDSGEVVGVVQDNNGTVGASGFVYLARSVDGDWFDVSKLSGAISGRYRPSLAPSLTTDSDIIVIFSTTTGATITGYKHRLAETPPLEAERRRLLEALQAGAKGLSFSALVDEFERADGTAAGNSSGGQVWTQVSGSDFVGINSGCATNLTTGNCRAHVDVGVTAYSMIAHIGSGIGQETHLMVRFVDGTNYLRVSLASTPPRLESIVAGAATTLYSFANALVADGDIVRLEVQRESIHLFINGLLYGTCKTSQFQDATRCGLQMSGTANLPKIRALAVLPI